MAIGTTAALVAGGLGLAGGVAGAMGSQSSQESQIQLGPDSKLQELLFGSEQFENKITGYEQKAVRTDNGLQPMGMRTYKNVDDTSRPIYERISKGRSGGALMDQYQQLSDMTAAGPGQQDVEASLGASRGLADLLGQMQQSGGLPGAEDIAAGQSTAGGLFNARRTALTQSFNEQNIQANRLSAQLGRSVDDPVLQAKLRQGFMQQSDMLESQQQDMGNQLALQLPGQRLAYAGDRANVLSGLAGQAFQNRAAIMSLGSQLGGAERDFQIRTGKQLSTGEQGGGLGGAISGALGGLGTGLSLGNLFGAGGSGGLGTANGAGMLGTLQGINVGQQLSSGMGGPSLFGGGAGGGGGAVSTTSLGQVNPYSSRESYSKGPMGFGQFMAGRP